MFISSCRDKSSDIQSSISSRMTTHLICYHSRGCTEVGVLSLSLLGRLLLVICALYMQYTILGAIVGVDGGVDL